MEALVGPELVTKDGAKSTADALKGAKVVGLYFSAHWCPPCRMFTPSLGKFYDKIKGENGFEVIFVSSDKDEESFESYYGEQASWLALPYSDRDGKAALSKRYKVRGIPTLVLVDGETGETITTEGRMEVSGDPDGARFPWRPKSLDEILADVPALKSKEGPTVPIASLKGKALLIYFSAHWCPPCRGFTPELVEFYNDLEAAVGADGVAIVFVSSDKTSEAFDEYFGDMGAQWLALPFEAREAKEALSKHFDVSGIPSLVCLTKEDTATGKRSVVTKSARGFVGEKVIDGFPASWADKPYADLASTTECNGSDINETRSLILLCDSVADGSSKDSAIDRFKKAATDHASADLLFYFATKAVGPVPQIRKLCNCPPVDGEPSLVLLDIPDGGGFYVSQSADAISGPGAMLDFAKAPGERMQLQ